MDADTIVKIIVALIAAAGTIIAAYLGYRATRSSSDNTPNADNEAVKPSEGMWPDKKSLEALKRRLESTSERNRNILRIIAQATHGIYVIHLVDMTKIPRSELIYRVKELERQELIEIRQMTDYSCVIHHDVLRVVGTRGDSLLNALLA